MNMMDMLLSHIVEMALSSRAQWACSGWCGFLKDAIINQSIYLSRMSEREGLQDPQGFVRSLCGMP
jgi:hypothetical protein